MEAARATRPFYKRPWFWMLSAVAVAAVVVAVVVPVVLVAHKDSKHTSGADGAAANSGGSNTGNTGGGNTTSGGNTGGGAVRAVTGGDGSTITMEDGTTFTYHNQFGGFCEYSYILLSSVFDPASLSTSLVAFYGHATRFLRFKRPPVMCYTSARWSLSPHPMYHLAFHLTSTIFYCPWIHSSLPHNARHRQA